MKNKITGVTVSEILVKTIIRFRDVEVDLLKANRLSTLQENFHFAKQYSLNLVNEVTLC